MEIFKVAFQFWRQYVSPSPFKTSQKLDMYGKANTYAIANVTVYIIQVVLLDFVHELDVLLQHVKNLVTISLNNIQTEGKA